MIPAHKQTDPTKAPGQIVPKEYKTLSDYVKQVQIEEAAQPSKQSFEQWWLSYNTLNGCPPAHVVAEAAWKAAKGEK